MEAASGESGFERVLGRLLAAWVDGVTRRARLVLALTAVLTLGLAVYALTHLGINTQHTAILSGDLPFWVHYQRFAKVFPIVDEALFVVVDGDSPSAAGEAADALAARLAEQPDRFKDVYVPRGGDFFERHALLYLSTEELQDLGDHLARVQPLLAEVARDRSITNLTTVLREGIDHLAEDPDSEVDMALAFDSLSLAAEAVLEGRPEPISWTDLLLQGTLPGESSRRLIITQPVFDYDRLLPGQTALEQVRAAARDLGLQPEYGIRVRVTGNVALNTEEMLGVARGALFAAIGCIVGVGVILTLALRTLGLVLAILATLVVGLIGTAAFAALAVGSLNAMSAGFAVLFIGLGVDFGIHFGMRYAELLRAGNAQAAAVRGANRSVGGSLVLCSLTTALGFYVFVPADYTAAAELGLISGTGMLISLFCTLTVLPALLVLRAGRNAGHEWAGARRFEQMLIGLGVRRARRVRWCAAALGLASLALIPFAHFNHNVIDLRDPTAESVQAFRDLLADSDTAPWTIDVLAEDLDAGVDLAERLRPLRVVERAVTLRDYVPTDQAEKLAIIEDLTYFLPAPPDEASSGAVPALDEQIAALRALRTSLDAPWLTGGDAERARSAARAAEHLDRFLARLETAERQEVEVANLERSLTGSLPEQLRRLWLALEPAEVTLADLPDGLRRQMLAADGRARVQVLPRGDLGDSALHARFVDDVQELEPTATGSAVSLLEWGRAVGRTFRDALISAVVLVSLLLWLLWRRVGDMLLVLSPLLLAGALTTSVTVLLDMPFNFGNVIVLPLLLGIGVDSGIHLVHRHRETLERGGPEASPERTLLVTSTAQAVFFSAFTTMGSFASLAFSPHLGIASMGQLLVIGVTLTLLCNLIVLPALIEWRREAAAAPRDRSPAEAA